MPRATEKWGVVFSVRAGEPGQAPSDYKIKNAIGIYEEQPNGEIRVSLQYLPWGGGHMLMRPYRPKNDREAMKALQPLL